MKNLFESIRFIGFGAPLCALRFADGGSGDDEDKDDDKGGKSDSKGKEKDKGKDDSDQQEPEKKYSQVDLDAAVESRLARERRKWEREHPELKKDGGDEKDQKKDDSPADDGSAAKLAAANQKLVQAEAKAVALSLGIKSERVAYAVRMADLSKIDVDDELGVDGEAVKKAIEQVLKDIPELKPAEKADEKKGTGFKVGADGDNSGDDKKVSLKDAVAAYYKK